MQFGVIEHPGRYGNLDYDYDYDYDNDNDNDVRDILIDLFSVLVNRSFCR
jgi:hypothetical protein